MPNVEIIAEGSFAKTPCAHVLLYVRDRSLTGTLVVRAEEGRHMAYFDAGRLVQVDNPPSDLHGGAMPERLGEVLVSMGSLTEEALSEGVVGPGMIGERLVALGACNERASEAALAEQTRRRGARMVECDGVQLYAFHSGNLLR